MAKPVRTGFTLIELLVVIAILVLLMAILLPVIHRARKQTAAIACQSNLRQWALLVEAYVAGNDGKFFYEMTHVDDVSDPRPASIWVQSWWYIFLTDFQDFRDIWLCPMAKTASADGSLGEAFRAWRGVTGAERLPEGGWGEVAREFLGSYGVNAWVGLSRHWDIGRSVAYNSWSWTTPDVREAANVPLVFDCRVSLYYGSGPNGAMDPPPAHPEVGPAANYSSHICIDRHTGGVNSMFMDSSVRKVGLKQLWGLKWNKEYNTAGPWTPAGGVEPTDWPAWMKKYED